MGSALISSNLRVFRILCEQNILAIRSACIHTLISEGLSRTPRRIDLSGLRPICLSLQRVPTSGLFPEHIVVAKVMSSIGKTPFFRGCVEILLSPPPPSEHHHGYLFFGASLEAAETEI